MGTVARELKIRRSSVDRKSSPLTVERVISRHQRKILTYDQLDRDSNALARGLEARGVTKGCRVAVCALIVLPPA